MTPGKSSVKEANHQAVEARWASRASRSDAVVGGPRMCPGSPKGRVRRTRFASRTGTLAWPKPGTSKGVIVGGHGATVADGRR